MAVSAQTMINSRLGVGLALGFGRSLPPRVGYPLADAVAAWISTRRHWSLVRAVRANQWTVHSGRCTESQLDDAVRQSFRHTAHCIFDLYHHLGDAGAAGRLIEYTPSIQDVIYRSQSKKEGQVIVGVHLSNFDFVLQAGGLRGLRALALSAPHPGEGYEWQNDLRRKTGLEVIPASLSSLRVALDRLQSGGTVLTGIDRPVVDPKYRPCFFGRPSALPVNHIYLALKAGVPVIVMAVIMGTDGVYRVHMSDPVEMKRRPDRSVEILQNAEAVLRVAEEYIRRAPHQWSMFYPVWPDVLEQMP